MLTLSLNSMADELAEKLRDAIRSCGLSHNALADKIGIKQPVISRFVNGGDMKLSTASKLCAFFNLSLTDDRPPAKRKRS